MKLNLNNADPFGIALSDYQRMHEIIDEASELAHEAYENQNAEAIAHAERLLFTITINNSFVAPLSSEVAFAWDILMGAKLKATITPHLIDNRCRNLEDLQLLLRGAVAKADREDHPWIDEILKDSPYEQNFKVYVKNWYITAYGFCHQLISLGQHCNVETERVVFANVADELRGTDHATQRAQFFEGICGKPFNPREALKDPDILTEAFSLFNYRSGVATLQNPSFALGSFYAVEAAYVPSCERLLKGLHKHAFRNKEILDYVTEHGILDVKHSEEWLEVMKKADLTQRDFQYVAAGALAQLDIRHQWFNKMRSIATSRESQTPGKIYPFKKTANASTREHAIRDIRLSF
jgi:pyrroloquinoline quinone (PQQ) biosynthesis protein C